MHDLNLEYGKMHGTVYHTVPNPNEQRRFKLANIILPDRFWARVHDSELNDCWEWRGTNRKGYGTIGRIYAHRLMFEAIHGPIPAGLCICHSCDNPCCVNPAHLWAGTHKDNVHDMLAKGRRPLPGKRKLMTHCRRGHELSEGNIYHKRNGQRQCLACKRAATDRWNARSKKRNLKT